MIKWLRTLLFGPDLTPEQKAQSVRCLEAVHGNKLYRLDGQAAFEVIKGTGFPVRGDDGKRFRN